MPGSEFLGLCLLEVRSWEKQRSWAAEQMVQKEPTQVVAQTSRRE